MPSVATSVHPRSPWVFSIWKKKGDSLHTGEGGRDCLDEVGIGWRGTSLGLPAGPCHSPTLWPRLRMTPRLTPGDPPRGMVLGKGRVLSEPLPQAAPASLLQLAPSPANPGPVAHGLLDRRPEWPSLPLPRTSELGRCSPRRARLSCRLHASLLYSPTHVFPTALGSDPRLEGLPLRWQVTEGT